MPSGDADLLSDLVGLLSDFVDLLSGPVDFDVVLALLVVLSLISRWSLVVSMVATSRGGAPYCPKPVAGESAV